MPAILIFFLVCLGLFLVFPKGFKFMVGTWVGFMAGGFLWSVCALTIPGVLAPWPFLGFSASGVIFGCVIAASEG